MMTTINSIIHLNNKFKAKKTFNLKVQEEFQLKIKDKNT